MLKPRSREPSLHTKRSIQPWRPPPPPHVRPPHVRGRGMGGEGMGSVAAGLSAPNGQASAAAALLQSIKPDGGGAPAAAVLARAALPGQLAL